MSIAKAACKATKRTIRQSEPRGQRWRIAETGAIDRVLDSLNQTKAYRLRYIKSSEVVRFMMSLVSFKMVRFKMMRFEVVRSERLGFEMVIFEMVNF